MLFQYLHVLRSCCSLLHLPLAHFGLESSRRVCFFDAFYVFYRAFPPLGCLKHPLFVVISRVGFDRRPHQDRIMCVAYNNSVYEIIAQSVQKALPPQLLLVCLLHRLLRRRNRGSQRPVNVW